jgi:hypothetical protein
MQVCGPPRCMRFAHRCAHSGTILVSPGTDLADASAVQTQAPTVGLTSVQLDKNSSITVPVMESAAIRAKLPLLDIVIPIYGQADQVSVLVDGQPWDSCAPPMLGNLGAGATGTEEWKCACTAGAERCRGWVGDDPADRGDVYGPAGRPLRGLTLQREGSLRPPSVSCVPQSRECAAGCGEQQVSVPSSG